jgi:hypothetical protein
VDVGVRVAVGVVEDAGALVVDDVAEGIEVRLAVAVGN